MEAAKKAGLKFEQLVRIMDTLRSDTGCPWDKEQDEKSIANYFLEEVYEVLEAISTGNSQSLGEELGDVLMEIVFLARIFKEKEKFNISDVLEGINQKMIRRHPHVFEQKHIKSSERVLDEWSRQKKEEKGRASVLDGIVKYSPALHTAFQIGTRVSAHGFDWSQPLDAFQKVTEEISELEKAIAMKEEDEIMQEMGDILFSLVNVSRHLKINPEIALNQANEKFIRRFKYLEEKLREEGKELSQVSLDEMDEIWEESKRILAKKKI